MNLKFLKSLKIKKSFKKENFQVNINIFWRFFVLLFFMVIISGSVFVYKVFQKFNENFYNKENKEKIIDSNKKQEIENVLKYFEEKEKKSDEVILFNSVIDPSL